MPSDRKMSSYALTELKEIMNKKVNYQNWASFIAPHSRCARFPFRKKGKPGNSESTKNIRPGVGIISVGRSLRSQTNALQANEQKVKKKKKKKRNRKKKKQEKKP